MSEFTDSGASTLLVIAVAFCHSSIFGNWTVRNHLIEKCLHIISASKEDIMGQSTKWKVLLPLQSESSAARGFQAAAPLSQPFSGFSFEVVTRATHSFKGLFGSAQQNFSVLHSNSIAASPFPPSKQLISGIPQPFLSRSLQSLFSPSYL